MLLRLLLVVGLLFAVVHVLPFAGPREARPVKTIATNPETGHTYQIVWDHHSTWHEARDKAKGMQCNGLPGHLVTITSPEEQEFLVANFWNWHSGPLFIGASDADEEGVWKWVDGPQAGQEFFRDGHCVNGLIERWCANEPNNRGSEHDGGEDVAVWNWMSEASWNDVAANNRHNGYLVEFSPPASVAPKKAAAPRHTYLIRDLAPPRATPTSQTNSSEAATNETSQPSNAAPTSEVSTAVDGSAATTTEAPGTTAPAPAAATDEAGPAEVEPPAATAPAAPSEAEDPASPADEPATEAKATTVPDGTDVPAEDSAAE